ncbi:MCM-domain-containing protein [Rozella allomycis CSF55]|uniref:MCM-domain-containing protein n=1 Tax=Rozella allomycis (strain CSF55) TaxID=988480 RepID=A0A075B4L1_ROZAC|nr:Mini-chromosome maintenance, DNA-dependent ATPase domain-containing protein [Rozella allomycis CSF55]RKP20196.1 MCM-domain-containing protein [Rozella allomycis CSF55]|eukprot:EPZ36262.1 Mini-chromosome maintenance, DNA-dependent ATPase domain-containing protein [Rozella allomycis CSF55]
MNFLSPFRRVRHPGMNQLASNIQLVNLNEVSEQYERALAHAEDDCLDWSRIFSIDQGLAMSLIENFEIGRALWQRVKVRLKNLPSLCKIKSKVKERDLKKLRVITGKIVSVGTIFVRDRMPTQEITLLSCDKYVQLILHSDFQGSAGKEMSFVGYVSKTDFCCLYEASEQVHYPLQEPQKHRNLADMVNMLCPEVVMMDKVKKALLMSAICRLHVLHVGDPGTAKSKLLRQMECLVPCVSVTGPASTEAGLTASVVNSNIEPGALVLGNKKHVLIDELDKMPDGLQGVLHEAMEQKTVTINKHFFHQQYPADVAVCATANFRNIVFDPLMNVVQNIGVHRALLSRFDLVIISIDKYNLFGDRQLANALVREKFNEDERNIMERDINLMPEIEKMKNFETRIGDEMKMRLTTELSKLRQNILKNLGLERPEL